MDHELIWTHKTHHDPNLGGIAIFLLVLKYIIPHEPYLGGITIFFLVLKYITPQIGEHWNCYFSQDFEVEAQNRDNACVSTFQNNIIPSNDIHIWQFKGLFSSPLEWKFQCRIVILTIQFDYNDGFVHMSNKPSSQLKPKKTPLVKKTIVSINRASNKKAIQVPLVKKPIVVINKPTYTSI